jgi:hypothetical protein
MVLRGRKRHETKINLIFPDDGITILGTVLTPKNSVIPAYVSLDFKRVKYCWMIGGGGGVSRKRKFFEFYTWRPK